ncbi:MAG: type II toxin-antitoxin system VapC family toxin [Acidimicrobiales bacterium]
MKLLLDTHVWLWLQHAPERLGDALELVEDPANDLLFSAASSWEIAIKWALGKLVLPEPPASYVPDRVRSSGVVPLAVEHIHALAVGALPSHHRDPFDRLLVGQAVTEGATLVTADPAFRPYDLEVVWTAAAH